MNKGMHEKLCFFSRTDTSVYINMESSHGMFPFTPTVNVLARKPTWLVTLLFYSLPLTVPGGKLTLSLQHGPERQTHGCMARMRGGRGGDAETSPRLVVHQSPCKHWWTSAASFLCKTVCMWTSIRKQSFLFYLIILRTAASDVERFNGWDQNKEERSTLFSNHPGLTSKGAPSCSR